MNPPDDPSAPTSFDKPGAPTAVLLPPGPAPSQPAGEPRESRRFHALDSLRASMMFLGIYLHAVVGYSREGGWPYKDSHPTAIYDWTLGYIHAFRMPLFYVMAGFFAAMLTSRRGLGGFLANRARRILVPFVVGWALMYPVVCFLSTYVRVADQPQPWAIALRAVVSGEILRYLHPLHLWFLEYLLVLCAIQAAAAALLPKVCPAKLLSGANDAFRWLLQCPWKPLILAVPTFFVLCMMNRGFLDDPPGFIPVPRIVLAYVICFAFGWLLYQNVDLLGQMQRWARTQVALTLAVVALFLSLDPWMNRNPAAVRLAIAAASSLIMWLMICGLTGVFLRCFDRPMPRARYLADSSYWLYIIHMPVLIVLQVLLMRLPWPAAIKVWIVLALAIPLMLLSYHFCVRPTLIGQVLNGRRYPISPPPAPGARG